MTFEDRPGVSSSRTRRRPRWIGREEFLRRLSHSRSDPGLRRDLDELVPDTTDGDDLAIRFSGRWQR